MFEVLKEFALRNNIPIMRALTAELLEKVIREYKPNNILEIGTAIGYSGIIMLSNSSKAKLTTIEIDEDRAVLAVSNFNIAGLKDRVNIICADVMEVVPCIDVKYDFILLDGPKGQYLELFHYLDRLLEVDGIIFADNVLYMGLVGKEGTIPHKHRTIAVKMNKFIQELSSNTNYQTSLHHIEDGILIARKING